MAWKQLKIGAGGFTNNLDIHADGTKVTRTDTMGAWIKRPGEAVWSQIVSSATMPAGDLSRALDSGLGVYEIRIANTNSSRLFMYYSVWDATAQALKGFVYRSNDAARSWTLTNFPQHYASGNDQVTEALWPYMAIDPVNADVVFVGTPSSGLFRTDDAGGTFGSAISAVGTGSPFPGSNIGQGGGHLIAFDTSGGTTVVSGKTVTKNIFVSTYGIGVFSSTNGGVSWTQISGAGTANTTLTTHQHIVCDPGGILYVVDNSGTVNQPSGRLNKFSAGTWSQFGSGSGISNWDQLRCAAVDPANASNLVTIANASPFQSFSNDAGATWHVQAFTYPLVATDIPWLGATDENPLIGGNIVFDPSQSNVLYFGTGIGIFKCSPSIAANVQWTSESADIEQLVVNHVIKPPGGSLIVNCLDRPVFTVPNPNAYATQHGVNYSQTIDEGYHSDWASADPRFIVTNNAGTSGYSLNGGGSDGAPANWTMFANFPVASGSIAAASSSALVFCQNAGSLYITANLGATAWTHPATAPTSGWGYGANFRATAVCADRVNIGTFYAFNTGNYNIASGSYNSGTGLVTLTLPDAPTTLSPGASIVTSLSGTGSVASLNGTFSIVGVSGSTVTYTAGTGLTLTITGGTFSVPAQIGVWRSTDSGAAWALANNSAITSSGALHFKLRSVPNNAGHLFFCGGQADDDTLKVPIGTPSATNLFYICTNATTSCTFSAMSNVRDVYAYGFGAPKVTGHYPSVYIYGFVDLGTGYVGGIWRCDDATTSPVWTLIGDLNPEYHLDRVSALDADMNTFGIVYVGFTGSGCAYFDPNYPSATRLVHHVNIKKTN